jgi:AcrR family transcriptional regulator
MTDRKKPYHHGNLREVLVDAAVQLIEEAGIESLSLRAVARKAGVSPAAPFRHFASKAALIAAVGQQAMLRLRSRVDNAHNEAQGDGPLAALEAIGLSYLRWAAENPTHFQIISSRMLISYDGVASRGVDNDHIRSLIVAELRRAKDLGQLSANIDEDVLVLSMRAFAYGLARMRCDGHLPEWHPDKDADTAVEDAMQKYLRLVLTL